MCRLVFIGVRNARDDVAAFFRARRFTAVPAANPTCEAMPPDAVRLQITNGMCSCSIYRVPGGAPAFDEAHERQRYARRGWTAAKIERALDSSRAAHERRPRGGIAREFVDAITQLVRSGAAVTLLAHDFTDLFTTP